MTDFTGRTLHHYQILLQIRETPTRVLYRVYDKKAHAFKALEVVKGTWVNPAELLDQLNKHFQLLARLAHQNIAHVSDLGVLNGDVYVVYNFHPKYPLRRFFNRSYPWEETARELAPVAHALMHAHSQGIIHGYLNPASILLDDKDNPVLFDFGLESIITDYLLAHSPGFWINQWGLMYRAPEQIRGMRPDPRIDIYSFGILIREWQTGNIDSGALLHSPAGKTPTKRPRGQQPVPKWFQRFIQKCTATDPSKRYTSVDEVFVILANGALHKSITSQMVKKPLDTTLARFTSRWAIFSLIISAVLVAAGSLLVNMSGRLWTSDTSNPSPVPTVSVATQAVAALPPDPSPATPVASMSPSPDEGQTVAEVLYPVYQGVPLAPLPRLSLEPGTIDRISLIGQWGMGILSRLTTSPDGRHVAAATSTGIFIFNADNLQVEKHIAINTWVSAIEFSPDGSLLASGDENGLIQLWETRAWIESGSPYSAHTDTILDLAFSPDGTQLVSVARDDRMVRWAIHTPEQPVIRDLPAAGVNAIAYSPDNLQLVLGGADFQIQIWDAQTLERLKSLTLSSKILDIDAVQGTNRFLIGGSDNQVILLDLEQEAPIMPLGSLRYPLTSVAASPGGTWLAAADLSGGITVWGKDGTLTETSYNFLAGSSEVVSLLGTPHDLAFGPDENVLFSGTYDGILRVLSAPTGKEIYRNQTLMGRMEKLVISDKTKYALMQDRNQTLTLWDLASGSPLYQIHGEIKEGNPFSPDERLIAVAANKTTVKVYDTNRLEEIYTFNDLQDVRTILFLNQSTQLAAGFDKHMQLWSISSGQELVIEKDLQGTGCNTYKDIYENSILRITSYQHIVNKEANVPGICTFQPLNWTTFIARDSRMVAYGGSSKLSVVNMQNAAGETVELDVNRRNVVQVALSSSGKLLAAAFDDHVISLWDVSTGQEVVSLVGHRFRVTDLAFSPDETLLFSTSRDGTIRIWGVPSGESR